MKAHISGDVGDANKEHIAFGCPTMFAGLRIRDAKGKIIFAFNSDAWVEVKGFNSASKKTILLKFIRFPNFIT